MMLPDTLAAAGIAGPSAVTVGTFDGVHLGHRHLIEATSKLARLRSWTAVALAFRPRPLEILRPGSQSLYLCSLDERCRRLREAGADAVIVVDFNLNVAHQSPREFTTTLVDQLGMKGLVGGPDLALGHRREGTLPVLRELGNELGFEVTVVPELVIDGETVRTRVVRNALEAGDVDRAPRILGRYYGVQGVVVPGAGRGRIIGVPTANVVVDEKIALPSNGVYAVYFYENGIRHAGAGNLGVRPTFNQQTRSLEIHLLDYSGDLYGQTVVVEFVRRLRPEVRFPGVSDLVAQIGRDIENARAVLA